MERLARAARACVGTYRRHTLYDRYAIRTRNLQDWNLTRYRCANRSKANDTDKGHRAVQVMWSHPWFFVIACLHLGQGLVAPFCLSLRMSSLNFSSAWAFSIDLRRNRERHAIDAPAFGTRVGTTCRTFPGAPSAPPPAA